MCITPRSEPRSGTAHTGGPLHHSLLRTLPTPPAHAPPPSAPQCKSPFTPPTPPLSHLHPNRHPHRNSHLPSQERNSSSLRNSRALIDYWTTTTYFHTSHFHTNTSRHYFAGAALLLTPQQPRVRSAARHARAARGTRRAQLYYSTSLLVY